MTKNNVDFWAVKPSEHTDFFIPEPRDFPAGKLHDSEDATKAPKLFTPLKIKNMTVTNRVGVSPMCTYSAPNSGELTGHATQFHQTHYGAMALRAPGLIIIEAAAVNPQGRLSPEDLGIWTDAQARDLKKIVDFAHSQGVKIGCQLGHGGRKASGFAMPIHLGKAVGKEYKGWADTTGTVGPSAIAWEEGRYVTPKELTKDEIKGIVEDFRKAAKRCYEIAGFDFVEIHGAHGYLITEFYSGISNKRTDEYGGSFENRIRFLTEIVDATVSPDHPLFVRISATDKADDVEGAWTIEQSKKLADVLAEHGVDFLDVSDGGNYHSPQRGPKGPAFQRELAKAIKDHVGDKLIVSTVGRITSGTLAEEILQSGDADFTLVGSGFLKNPGLVWAWADELGVRVNTSWSYTWPFHPSPYAL